MASSKLSFHFPDNESVFLLNNRSKILSTSLSNYDFGIKFNDDKNHIYEIKFNMICENNDPTIYDFTTSEGAIQESYRDVEYFIEENIDYKFIILVIRSEYKEAKVRWKCRCSFYHPVKIKFEKLEGL